MKAQIVHESMFGDTMLIAGAVADGVGRHGHVDVIEVGKAGPPPQDLDLLVLGGPTHAFGLSRPGTRQYARHRGDRIARLAMHDVSAEETLKTVGAR